MFEIYIHNDTFEDDDAFTKVFKASRFLEFTLNNIYSHSDKLIKIKFKRNINITLLDLLDKSLSIFETRNWFLWFYAFTLLFRSWQRKIHKENTEAWTDAFVTSLERELIFENVMLKSKLCCTNNECIENALNYSYAYVVKQVSRSSIKIEPFGRAEVKNKTVSFTKYEDEYNMEKITVECPYSETITGFKI